MITTPTHSCFACGSMGYIVQDKVEDPDETIPGEWAFRKCSNQNCELVWLDPAPLETELWKAYVAYHTHTRVTNNRVEKLMLSFANRLIRMAFLPVWIGNGLRRESDYLRYMTLKNISPGRLLDVGCGGGRLMNRMARMGWEVEGIDFDEKATDRITRRYGMKTYTGDLVSCKLPEASYDAITMSHTIEHLFDPEKILAECRRILKSGGRLIITTPNVEGDAATLFGRFWRGWEPPRHLHLFSVKTLNKLLLHAGFEMNEVRSTSVGAAGVYRASRMIQQKGEGSASFLFQLRLILWSYQKELEEFRAQKAGRHAGQNLLAIANKPLQPNS